MKKLLVALLALGALSMVPTAEAGKYTKKSCGVAKSCAKPCAPKCTKSVQKEIFYTPCEKVVRVQGQCANERCITTTVCEDVTEKCIGGCEAYCDNAVNPADRGGLVRGDMVVNE